MKSSGILSAPPPPPPPPPRRKQSIDNPPAVPAGHARRVSVEKAPSLSVEAPSISHSRKKSVDIGSSGPPPPPPPPPPRKHSVDAPPPPPTQDPLSPRNNEEAASFSSPSPTPKVGFVLASLSKKGKGQDSTGGPDSEAKAKNVEHFRKLKQVQHRFPPRFLVSPRHCLPPPFFVQPGARGREKEKDGAGAANGPRGPQAAQGGGGEPQATRLSQDRSLRAPRPSLRCQQGARSDGGSPWGSREGTIVVPSSNDIACALACLL